MSPSGSGWRVGLGALILPPGPGATSGQLLRKSWWNGSRLGQIIGTGQPLWTWLATHNIDMHAALVGIRQAIAGTPFEENIWLVGGAVRDALLGRPVDNDFDLVTRGSAPELARLLWKKRVSSIPPVVYERFGTAMVQVQESTIELVTARRESYSAESRKPTVEPASLDEDAARRDFTVNTLLQPLNGGAVLDPLGIGFADLQARTLRTPLDPVETFRDDPLRMLRAVRFRWKLGFEPAPGLFEAISEERERLRIVSNERIRDELIKMLVEPSAADALDDLMQLGLLDIFAPELRAMVGCEQGKWHHLDVWDHTLLVVRNLGGTSLSLSLAALLHDVAKPSSRTIDEKGDVRFFGHESEGAQMTRDILTRLRFPGATIKEVEDLVQNHMRLSSFTTMSPSAARRLVRDLGDRTDDLLTLIQADADALKPGVKTLDLTQVRAMLCEVREQSPPELLDSPLSGAEIMAECDLPPGPEIGRLKSLLAERVLDGQIEPGDKEAARRALKEVRT